MTKTFHFLAPAIKNTDSFRVNTLLIIVGNRQTQNTKIPQIHAGYSIKIGIF